MEFKNWKETSKKLGVSSGKYYTLEDGENKLRILTLPESLANHYISKSEGSETCTMDGNCPWCKQKLKQNWRVLMYVLDRNENKVKLLEAAWSIYTGLGELAESSEYGYEGIPPYDVIITKKDDAGFTKYTVQAGRNESPVSKEIMDELKEKEDILSIVAKRLEEARQNAGVADPDEDKSSKASDLPF
jgi:hypothetical protein